MNNIFEGMSEIGLRVNIKYFEATKQYRNATLCYDVLNKPKTDEFISKYNKTIADIDAKQKIKASELKAWQDDKILLK